jgi:hypothetical protein
VPVLLLFLLAGGFSWAAGAGFLVVDLAAVLAGFGLGHQVRALRLPAVVARPAGGRLATRLLLVTPVADALGGVLILLTLPPARVDAVTGVAVAGRLMAGAGAGLLAFRALDARTGPVTPPPPDVLPRRTPDAGTGAAVALAAAALCAVRPDLVRAAHLLPEYPVAAGLAYCAAFPGGSWVQRLAAVVRAAGHRLARYLRRVGRGRIVRARAVLAARQPVSTPSPGSASPKPDATGLTIDLRVPKQPGPTASSSDTVIDIRPELRVRALPDPPDRPAKAGTAAPPAPAPAPKPQQPASTKPESKKPASRKPAAAKPAAAGPASPAPVKAVPDRAGKGKPAKAVAARSAPTSAGPRSAAPRKAASTSAAPKSPAPAKQRTAKQRTAKPSTGKRVSAKSQPPKTARGRTAPKPNTSSEPTKPAEPTKSAPSSEPSPPSEPSTPSTDS